VTLSDTLDGLNVREIKVLGGGGALATVTETEELRLPMLAVTVAVPDAVPVTNPPWTVAVAGFDVIHWAVPVRSAWLP
jgi:hypothetical protein